MLGLLLFIGGLAAARIGTDEDHQRREQHEIEHRAPFFMGEIYAHAERSQQGYYEEHEAGIDGQSQ